MRTFDEWMHYIESMHPSDIELGLDRIQKVADVLEIGNLCSQVITVTGTNGKGSCVKSLQILAQASGLTTASYTSPHIIHFNERLLINDQPIDNKEWCQAFEHVELACGETRLTFFEFTTLSAFLLIRQYAPDLAILEVGLGGRLDAVNIIQNHCGIVTSVALDHQQWLGNTLDDIAREKSGIFKERQRAIVSTSDVAKLVEPYVTECQPIIVANEYCDDVFFDSDFNWRYVSSEISNTIHPSSFSSALAAAHCLGWKLPSFDQITTLFKHVQLKGRWYQPDERKNLWLDVAHNDEAILNLVNKITHSGIANWQVICGMLVDKSAAQSIRHLSQHVETWHLIPIEGVRGQSSEQLSQKLSSFGVNDIVCHQDTESALASCRDSFNGDSGVLAFGSFRVVESVIHCLQTDNM